MARLLTFVIIALVVYLLLKGLGRKNELRERGTRPRAASSAGEDMVACARCGVNVPRSEVREEAGRLVCADNPRCKSPA